jgi:trk system potassium uptake protein TrkA
MKVIIVGGGKTGSHLTSQLLGEGHQVRLIEHRSEVLERLRQELPSDVITIGDGSSPTVLEEVGVDQVDVLVAATGEDEDNLVICTIGRFEFNVPRTIARINNPKNAWLFTPDMGVDVSLDQTDILAKLIAEEMSLGDMTTLLKLRRGEYSVVEEKLPHRSKILGIPLSQLPLPESCTIAAVFRKGKVLTPRGNMVFEEEDEILAVVNNRAKLELKELFAPP